MTIKKIFKGACPVLALLSISLWPLYLHIAKGRSIFVGVSLKHMPPLRFNAVQTMLEGSLPLWNPHIFAGMPLLGDATSDPFDLLNVSFLLFNPLLATIMLTASQIFFSGLFMYLYLKKSLHLEKLASLLGGVLYTLSACSGTAGLDFLGPLGSIMWLPLIMLFIDKSFEFGARSISFALLAGIAMAFAFFGGSGDFVFFIACFIALYVFFSPFPIKRKFLMLFITVAISVLVSAVQLFPTFQAASLSHRSIAWPRVSRDLTGLNLPSLAFSIFEFPARHFLYVFNLPSLESLIADYRSWYIGIFNLLLVSLAYFEGGDNYKIKFNKLFIPLLLIFQVCIFYFPIKGFLGGVYPPIKGMRFGHSMFLLNFSAAILIAHVANELLYERHLACRLERFVGSFRKLACPVIILLSAIIYFRGGYKYINNRTLSWAAPYKYEYACILVSLMLLCMSFFVLGWVMSCRGKTRKKVVYVLFLLIIANVAFKLAMGYGKHSSGSFKAHFKESAETRFLRGLRTEERVEVLYGGIAHGVHEISRPQHFGFNLPLFYRAHILGGCHPLHTARARIFFDMLNGRHPFDPAYYWKNGKYVKATGRAWLEGQNVNFNLINLSGVKYLFSLDEREEDFLTLKLRADNYFIYENLNAYPRAFIVYDYEVLNEKDVLDRLNDEGFNPLKKVLLEQPFSLRTRTNQPLKNEARKPSANIISYKPNEVVIEAESPLEGMLIFTDAYDKDWRAYVDGKETSIYQADYLFRVVPIPEGRHYVKFNYMPKSFVYGAYISIIALSLGLAYLIYNFSSPSFHIR